jgi:tetratricopeptide (TPR) repeat protein
MPENQYDAFISYRRSDGSAVARWLRRELTGFRIPRSMRAQFGRKLNVYLDTAYERGASDFYDQSVKPALLASSHLIVVATPNAVQRTSPAEDWIAREIADFAAGPNSRNVMAVRGAGQFSDPLPGDLSSRFPNIEIVDLRGAGRFWYFNPARVVRLTSEKLKIVAPLLGVPFADMPKLRQEEERRQQSLFGSATGVLLGVLVAVTGLSVFALQSRNQAVRSLEDSMFATGSMVLLATGITTGASEANTRIRRLLVNQGCDLVDNLSSGSGVPPEISELVTCKLERAKDHERLGEQTQARQLFESAISAATARWAAQPRPDAADQIIKAREAYSGYLLRQKDSSEVEAQYSALLEAARAFTSQDRSREQYVRAEGDALGALGDLYVGRGDASKASASYDRAAEAVSRVIGLQAEPAVADVEWLMRLYRLAGEQRRQAADIAGAIERYDKALQARGLVAAGLTAPALDQEAALADALVFSVERSRGNQAAADKAMASALDALGRVLAVQSASDDLKRRAVALKNWITAQSEAH